ncbi:MAG: hypothetical protein ACXWHC_18920, partial [Usitatibacter sp.]
MRLLALPIALSLAVFLAGCGGSNNNSREKITVAVIGDVPYGLTPTDTSQTLAFPGYVSAL